VDAAHVEINIRSLFKSALLERLGLIRFTRKKKGPQYPFHDKGMQNPEAVFVF